MNITLKQPSLIGALCALSCTMALANTNQHWNIHHGNYIGARIGFNFSKFGVEYNDGTQASSDRHGTVMQELMGGHFFTPHWALEVGVGSYFSSLGLGMRLGVKANLPVSQRWNLSFQAGGNYISSFLQNGLVGPYVTLGAEYALSRKISMNLEATDLLVSSDMNINSSWLDIKKITFNGNVISMVIGFSYYIP